MIFDEKINMILADIIAVGNRLDVTKIILFGSRARGDHMPKSDIDLAIYGAQNEAVFNDAIEEIDTLLKCDVVHITKDSSGELLRNIKKDGVTIMDKHATKLNNYFSALERLKEACVEYSATNSQVVRDGVIQRFEFTTELAWKAVREHLLDQGYTDINSPKAVMKAAYTEGIVVDDTGWIELLNARNTTTHIYDSEQAEKIYNEIYGKYLQLFDSLSAKLNKSIESL